MVGCCSWADGLGNPHANSLPGCQLDRIQRLLDHLPGESVTEHARWFWMDTLCVPVGEKNKSCRKAAIAQMADTYQGATAVLTLDAWLQTLPADSSITDKMARIYVSNWIHRLWTAQESVLCAKLYVQFADAAQLLEDIRLPCQRYRERRREVAAMAIVQPIPGTDRGVVPQLHTANVWAHSRNVEQRPRPSGAQPTPRPPLARVPAARY